MPSLTPTEPQTTDELPTGRLPDAGPAVPAATVRITTVALLPPAARRVAKPRAKAQTQPSATPKGQPKTKAQPSAKPQAPGAASAQAPAAPKRRKRPAAAAKAAAARIEAAAPARRFGLTAREQLTVRLVVRSWGARAVLAAVVPRRPSPVRSSMTGLSLIGPTRMNHAMKKPTPL